MRISHCALIAMVVVVALCSLPLLLRAAWRGWIDDAKGWRSIEFRSTERKFLKPGFTLVLDRGQGHTLSTRPNFAPARRRCGLTLEG